MNNLMLLSHTGTLIPYCRKFHISYTNQIAKFVGNLAVPPPPQISFFRPVTATKSQCKFYSRVIYVFFQECVTETGPRRSILLSVSERGVAILERVSMKVLNSYTYQEISTFGGNGDEHFMLVISSQDVHTPTGHRGNSSPSQGNVVEKLIFGMPKLKVSLITNYQ